MSERFAEMNGERKAKKGPPFQQWKPALTDDGKSRTYNVRFLPYMDQNEQPFQEVNYYDNKALSPWRVVAPAQFGMEDPISTLVSELRKQRNNKEAWTVIKGLLPRPRYFAPVFVREEAEKGVQIWELSPTVCKDIYSVLLSEDLRDEDVTDPNTGRDFQVSINPTPKTFTQPGTGKVYPVNETKVIARTKVSKLLKTEEDARKLIESIPDLQGIFKAQIRPLEELETMLENYLADDKSPAPESEMAPFAMDSKEDEPSIETVKSVEDQFADL